MLLSDKLGIEENSSTVKGNPMVEKLRREITEKMAVEKPFESEPAAKAKPKDAKPE